MAPENIKTHTAIPRRRSKAKRVNFTTS